MLKKDKVFLLGFMGSGKSHLGVLLAEKLNYRFVDLDDLIEKKTSKSIAEIFEKRGEAYFREIEAFYLKSLWNEENIVIALGGGTPCFYSNMDWVKEKGVSFYLNMPTSILVNRLMGETNKRPLLKGKTLEELTVFIEKKITERNYYYNQADFIINDSINALEEIIKLL